MPRRLHSRCVAILLAIAAASAAGAADSAALETTVRGAQQLVADGKLAHAQRFITRALEIHPGNPTLLELRARVEELHQRELGVRADGATPAVPEPVRPLPAVSASAPVDGRAFTLPELDLVLAWIPPGEFLMAELHGSDDATPVTISRGFWLGRTEVTQEQWRALRPDNQNPSVFKGSTRPVEHVSWIETMEFLRVLNHRERAAGRLPAGYEYTLPTEAEWEYACRAGSDIPGAASEQSAWFAQNSGGQTRPVGQLAPNAWGLHDMLGNVLEWCFDGPAPYAGHPVADPIQGFNGSAAPAVRNVRGGAWNSTAGLCRADFRYWRSVSLTSSAVGFRLALAPIRDAAALRPSAAH